MRVCMSSHIGEKVKGFLLHPAETFRATRAETLTSAYQYYVILLIIFSVLLAIVVSVSVGATYWSSSVTTIASSGLLGSNGSGIVKAFTAFLVTYLLFLPYFLFVFMLFAIFISGFYYHVFVILFGGQKGLTQTVKAVMYASTPALLLGWIPFVSFIGSVWTVILIIIGVRENQEMTTGRAVLVVLVPLVLTVILSFGLVEVFLSFARAIATLSG
jgi:hypothetical protein